MFCQALQSHLVQSRKMAKKTSAAKGGAPQGGALKQRDRMLSQVKAYRRLKPEDRRALLTDKVCMLSPLILWHSCPHPHNARFQTCVLIPIRPVLSGGPSREAAKSDPVLASTLPLMGAALLRTMCLA